MFLREWFLALYSFKALSIRATTQVFILLVEFVLPTLYLAAFCSKLHRFYSRSNDADRTPACPSDRNFQYRRTGQTFETIEQLTLRILNLFKGTSFLGIVSAMAWGLGYFGQPHIIVRFMAITTVKEIKSARRIGMFWMIFSLIGTILTALIGLAFFHQHSQYSLKNPEAVFIELGQILFHPLFAGFAFAAILAAIMSTISSQLIVTSSALVEDLYKVIIRKNAK